jgi:DNA invertase Pin-like site-specific DNA recombinase
MKTAEFDKSCQSSVPTDGKLQTGTSAIVTLPRSQKIAKIHLQKLAIVYVRQSSPHQVVANLESKARQYALVEYAQHLGWPADRVVVVDEDQARSGKTADNRAGFQHLLTEVTLDHVGLLLGLEMSRLARSNKDWHQLLELCAIFGTVLADQDGVYDASDPNDRLLLGLKGAISEMELHTMHNRLSRGRLNKARRGELFYSAPMGYVLLPSGEVAFDPDEQARGVVQLIFEKFKQLGTARGVFTWILEHNIQMPIRAHRGANKGQLDWRRPSSATLRQMLHHPIYAGAYSFGRRQEAAKRVSTASGPKRRTWLPPEKWDVLIRDRLPAYITWEQFLENRERLKQNQTRPETPGTPRNGCALLSGLLVCSKCGWRMHTDYHTANRPQYACHQHYVMATGHPCGCLSAKDLDALVTQQVLLALEPASLELSLRARADLQREQERLNRHRQQTLERARYEAELAERRYRAVDPANRLVAATLEKQWEEALLRERTVCEENDRCEPRRFSEFSESDRAAIEALATDVPALWRSPITTNAERQAIIRCLLEQVVVHTKQDSDRTEATLHWKGGHTSHLVFRRSVRSYDLSEDRNELLQRIIKLREAGNTAAQISATLNAEGYVPLRRDRLFTPDIVSRLLRTHEQIDERNDTSQLGSHEWFLTPLAAKLNMSRSTLGHWVRKGWIHSRRTKVQNVVIVWADADEIQRLKKLLNAGVQGVLGYSADLITPKKR